MDLVVKTSNPLVDDVKHGLALDGGSTNKSAKTKHSKTSIVDLSLLGNTRDEGGDNTIWLRSRGVITGVKKKRIRERKGAQGGEEANRESVDIGDKDDGPLVGDGVLAGDSGKGSPLLEVKWNVSVGDKAVSLGVGCGADYDPAEHGVAAVPLFGLDGRSPSELVELRVFLGPVFHGVVEDIELGVGPSRGNSIPGSKRGGSRSKARNGASTEAEGSKSTERRHCA